MKIKLISDLYGFGSVRYEGLEIKLLKYPQKGNKLLKIIKYFFISFSYDYFLLNFSNDIFMFGLLKLFSPFNSCRFIALDIFLPYPKHSIQDKIKKYIRIKALKSINLIFIYSKRNERLCETYKIDPKKMVYIPFKINSYDYVINQKASDRGYIFSGGRSRRDFQTLIKAGKDLQYPIKIVTPYEEESNMQGTFIDVHDLPSNVEFIHDDGSIESFISYIANSKLVVLPLKSQDFASTGTSVYLLSMVLKKCVIISSGPTTDDILTPEIAIIVPPEDPEALRKAIEKAFNDDEYRKSIAENGYKYAIGLGDEKTLLNSIIKEIYADYFLNAKE